MPENITHQRLTKEQQSRFRGRAIKASLVNERIGNLSDYLAVLDTTFDADSLWWFRGHTNVAWRLVPSAFRFKRVTDRRKAVSLLADFRRIAQLKHTPAPSPSDDLGWMQVGQHYGLPTQLLDWTENALAALYFACGNPEEDGLVIVMNPVLLNQANAPTKTSRVLDAQGDVNIISRYIGSEVRTLKPVAINPDLNSERIIVQKGTFTIHPFRNFELGAKHGDTLSLVLIPVPRESKPVLVHQLRKVGVDELSLYPELEHAAPELKRRVKLDEADPI